MTSTDIATGALSAYGVRAPATRPRARFHRWLTELHDALVALPTTSRKRDVVQPAFDADVRRIAFMLEGLYRVYVGCDGGRFDKGLSQVKRLEDTLGRVDYCRAMHAAAVEARLPVDAIAWLAQRVKGAEKALGKRIAKRWRPDADGRIRGVAKLVERLEAAPLDDEAADRTYLALTIADEMDRVGRRQYDLDELEAGVHEFRRDIRWFPIYFTALDGFAALDDTLNPIEAYESLLKDPAAESPYARLAASPDEPDPVRLSRSLYVANTKWIAELGDLKDRGQTIEGLAHALRESGTVRKRSKATDRALEALGLSHNDLHFIHERATTMRCEMVATDFWAAFRAPLAAAAG